MSFLDDSRPGDDSATIGSQAEEEAMDHASSTTVDARGVRCPMPVIMIARTAASLPGGALVTVLATDPAARYDVPAWARMRGHAVVHVGATAARPDEVRITVRLSADH